MKIKILKSATEDLMRGFRFYEHQDTGLGNYFLDSIFADIDSLLVSSGMHGVYFGKHRVVGKTISFCNLLNCWW
jgi:hypothetical protein